MVHARLGRIVAHSENGSSPEERSAPGPPLAAWTRIEEPTDIVRYRSSAGLRRHRLVWDIRRFGDFPLMWIRKRCAVTHDVSRITLNSAVYVLRQSASTSSNAP
jgi:hypothetical protein